MWCWAMFLYNRTMGVKCGVISEVSRPHICSKNMRFHKYIRSIKRRVKNEHVIPLRDRDSGYGSSRIMNSDMIIFRPFHILIQVRTFASYLLPKLTC